MAYVEHWYNFDISSHTHKKKSKYSVDVQKTFWPEVTFPALNPTKPIPKQSLNNLLHAGIKLVPNSFQTPPDQVNYVVNYNHQKRLGTKYQPSPGFKHAIQGISTKLTQVVSDMNARADRKPYQIWNMRSKANTVESTE